MPLAVFQQPAAPPPADTTGSFLTPWLQFVPADGRALVENGLQVAGILAMVLIAMRVTRMLANRIENRVAEEAGVTIEARDQRSRTVFQLLYSVIRVVIGLTGLLMILNVFFPIGPLLAGVGVLGLAVSFGAQNLVRDIISGFFIVAENQFGVGDVVEIGTVSGVVERMTLRVVMIRDVNGVLHIVPNGAIERVSNKTRDWARAVIDLGVGYGESVDRVMDILRDEMMQLWEDAKWRTQLESSPSVLGVQDWADSAVMIRVAADTRPGKQWEVRREMLRRVKNRFDAEGVEIPFPQRTVHLREPRS